MAEIKAKIGKKVTDAEVKEADPKKIGKLQAKHPKADVEAEYLAVQVCPYCGCVGYGAESPVVYELYTCHCCGRTFKA